MKKSPGNRGFFMEHVGLKRIQCNELNQEELGIFENAGRQQIRQSKAEEGRESACMARLVAAWLDLPAKAKAQVAEVAGEVLAEAQPWARVSHGAP